MFNRIRSLFDRWDEAPAESGPRAAAGPNDDLRLAAAALLVEAARSDDHVTAEERARIVALARRRFQLTEDEAEELLGEAMDRTAGASHLYDYVRTITDRCPPDERLWIVEMLWEVSYADGDVDSLEANLLRRVGGLLAVSDVDRGAARRRVRERLGLPDDTGVG